jgi:predicted nucleic acid-binding protein
VPHAGDIFVDTAGWADPLMGNSPDHATMEAYYRRLIAEKRSLLTTNYVIAELVALLTSRSRFTRPQIIIIVNRIRGMPRLRIEHIDQATDAEAWMLLEHTADKDWSLVDAASFVLMRRFGVNEAFITDHHFNQAGFIRLPQP